MATKAELATELAGRQGVYSLYYRQLLRYTKAELESRVERRRIERAKPKTTDHVAGEVHRHDAQADPYGGQFRLVEFDAATGVWTAEKLPPDAETYARILRDAENGQRYINVTTALDADSFVQAEAELAERESRAGDRFRVSFVSAAAYAEYF